MKRLILISLILIISAISYAFVINQTITIDATTLSEMRNPTNIHNTYLNNIPENLEYLNEEVSTRSIPYDFTIIHSEVKKINEILFNESIDEDRLTTINTRLNSLTPNTNFINYLQDPTQSEYQRTLDLTYYLINVSMLYDCLYYANTAYISQANKDKLKNILIDCIRFADEAIDSYSSSQINRLRNWGYFPDDQNYNYPVASIIQYRMQLYGAMGLASLLLRATDSSLYNEMNAYINEIDNIFLNNPLPSPFPTDKQYQGMLSFHTTISGANFESLIYQSQEMLMMCPFFTAYKRLSNGAVNYYNNPNIVSWANDLSQKLLPTKEHWLYNDEYATNTLNKYAGIAFFFYNNTNNVDVRNKCSWYIKLKGQYTPFENQGNILWSDILVKYLSNPYVSQVIGDISTTPEFVSQGSTSNQEFSILRKKISSNANTAISEYTNNPALYVLHKNNFTGYHAHSDHLSYSFYFNGKPFLIDPGYRVYVSGDNWNYGREWCRSNYAHNMIVANPLEEQEKNELRTYFWTWNTATPTSNPSSISNGISGTYRPYSAFNYHDSTYVTANQIVEDPCYRDYFQKSNELDILRTRVTYDNTNNTAISELTRSFFRINDVFVINDEITSLNGVPSNYWNLYQFGVFNSSSSVTQTNYGFDILKGTDNVKMICGSVNSFTNQIDNSSTGYDFDYFPNFAGIKSSPDNPSSSRRFGHMRGKTKISNTANPSFLTVMIPQSGNINTYTVDQTISSINNHFGASITKSNSFVPSTNSLILIGATNGSNNVVNFTNNTIRTNSRFFNVSKLVNSTQLKLNNSLVLNRGDFLKLNDTDLVRVYTNITYGISATYTSNKLDVIFNHSSIVYPRFKIYKNDTDPSQLSCVIRIQSDQNTPYPVPIHDDPNYRYTSTDILQSLASDGQYFYVNYTYQDLINNNLINDNLIIHKMTFTSNTINHNLKFGKGLVKFNGNNFVATQKTLSILQNAVIEFGENSQLQIDGTLNVNGSQNNNVFFRKDVNASGKWQGIKVNGTANLSYCTITDAIKAINCYGSLNINNSALFDNDDAIFINSCGSYSVTDNQIFENNGYGIKITDCILVLTSSLIENNDIYQNLYGLFVYNSNPSIDSNRIYGNKNIGLSTVHNASPIVIKTSISGTFNIIDYPEIYISDNSYPIVSNNSNDILLSDDYTVYNEVLDSRNLRNYTMKNIWWNTTNINEVISSIYAPSWIINISPISLSTNTDFTPPDGYESKMLQGLSYERTNNLSDAQVSYINAINEDSNSSDAFVAMNRLMNIANNDDTFSYIQLQNYYDSVADTTSNNDLNYYSRLLSASCDRKINNYQQAINKYSDLIENSSDTLDSLYLHFDIVNTYIEAYNFNSRAPINFLESKIKIKNIDEALTLENSLLNLINKGRVLENLNHVLVTPPNVVLNQNYPNPANPSTTISFSLPEDSNIELSIFNVKGQKVKTLKKEYLSKGTHNIIWEGNDSNNNKVASGIYFYKLITKGQTYTKKMILMK